MLHVASRKNPVAIPGEQWAIIREAYSNWDGAPASVNMLARKLGLARRTVKEILKTMQTTHDSPPWTDESIAATGEDELVEDLIRRKEEKVLVTAERKEWSKIKKDAEAFRRVDLAAKRLALRFEQIAPAHKIKPLKLPKAVSPFSVVMSPTDFHYGKFAPAFTGDYFDRKVARKRLMSVTKRLLGRVTKRGKPNKIILSLNGDCAHIDNALSTTTRGTAQSCDGEPEQITWGWIELARDYIDLLRQVAPVQLLVIPGNHDYYTSTLVRAALKGWFSTVREVEVVESFSPRQYIVCGSSLLTFLHGDIPSKSSDWPSIIAGEVPRLWGEARHRYCFAGHLHTEKSWPSRSGSVVFYRMPSLAGTDHWHFKQGYQSRKALIAYVVDQKRGVIGTEIEPAESKHD